MRLISLLALPGLMLGTAVAAADFVPGRAYYSFSSFENCYERETEQIWEFDPATGASRRFATIPWPDCGGLSGLAFTPDGRGLRVSNYLRSSILEIDGDGNYRTVYDYDDGVSYPVGANNITFDAAGNFYVSNGAPGPLGTNIIKFAAGGTTGEPFAHVIGSGPLVSLPDGYLYFGSELGGIDRIAPDGSVVQLDSTISAMAMAAHPFSDFYVIGFTLTEIGIFRYRNGGLREFLAPVPFANARSTITVTSDPFTLLLSYAHGVWSFNTITRTLTELGRVGDPFMVGPGGAAYYVPEPASAFCALTFVSLTIARRQCER